MYRDAYDIKDNHLIEGVGNSMNKIYIVVEDGVIVNSFVCEDEDLAQELHGIPSYIGACVGDPYMPPPTDSERIEALESENALLKAQLQAQTERSDFIEDCIAEMATQVYAQ